MRLVVVAFLVQRFRARLRFFPLWQQAGAIGLLLLNDRFISALVHWLIGAPQAGWASWFGWLLAWCCGLAVRLPRHGAPCARANAADACAARSPRSGT
jgi:cell shape-determining protein MreD